MARRESDIERLLVRRVEETGGLALKFSSATRTGYPDRLCLFPRGRAVWVELKAPGKKPRLLQRLRHDELRHLGFTVEVIDSPEQIETFIDNNAQPF